MLGALLSACTSGPPNPRKAAEALAKGLTKQDLKGVRTVKGGRIPQADLERIVKGMTVSRPMTSTKPVAVSSVVS